MIIGTHVRLKHRHAFRNSQPDLSEAIGVVGDIREEDGFELLTVVFGGFGIVAPDAPAEFFEVVAVH